MSSIPLPPSLDKSLHTLDREVEAVAALSPEQRLNVLAGVCKTSLQILKLNKNKVKLLTHRDPWPESTIVALKRLHVRT